MMKNLYFLLGVTYFVYIVIQHVEGETEAPQGGNGGGSTVTDKPESSPGLVNIDPTQSYCFRYTWLGPEFDNATETFNTTCAEFLSDRNAVEIPCRQPMVITFDGTPPDINYLWENHQSQVICRAARGQVCAKYSYSFNGALQNVTYMCARVFSIDEGPVRSGCYKQKERGFDVEVCVCETPTGGYKPCNSASLLSISIGCIYVLNVLFYFSLIYY